MATTTTATSAPPGFLDDIKRRSGWGLFMGILTMALGVVLIIYPFATATATAIFLGSMLIVVGVAELVLGFSSLSRRGFFAQVFLAILYGFTGGVLILYPFEGVESLTLFVGAMLIVRGVLAVIAGFRFKPLDGWGWFLADGIGSLAAGGLILAEWPSSTSWAVGTLVGASVLITGVARTAFAARVRRGASDIQQRVRAST